MKAFTITLLFLMIVSGNDCFGQGYISELDSIFTNNIETLYQKCKSVELYDALTEGNDSLKEFLFFCDFISPTLFTVSGDGKPYDFPHIAYACIDEEHVKLLDQWYQNYKYAISSCMSIEDYYDKNMYIDPLFYRLSPEEAWEYFENDEDIKNIKVFRIIDCIEEYKKELDKSYISSE